MISDFPTLCTERLILRELSLKDASALFSIHSDAEAMRWFGCDPMTELKQGEQLINIFSEWRTAPNPGIRWGIERRVDCKLIGSCGLFKWNPASRVCSTSYELARDARGQGFMQEALTAAVNWGMLKMELNRVEARIYAKNSPSIRLAERLGFRFEGTLRQLGYWRNQFHDLDGYSLLRGEWFKNES